MCIRDRLRTQDDSLAISFDAGEKWEKIKDIEENANQVYMDPFNRHDRAFVTPITGSYFYMTDDQGISWKTMNIKDSEVKSTPHSCHIVTHPTNKEHLIATCSYCEKKESSGEASEGRRCFDKAYGSSDSGTVSYTHLDVYKRQILILPNLIS